MKIAHINMIFSKGKMSGVEKKLIDEARAMSKKGIDVYLLNREKNAYENNIHYINMDNISVQNIFLELYMRMFKYAVIESLIDLSKYNFFILRYTLVDFSAFSFSKKYKNKIITEHHTKELKEIKVQDIKEPFKTVQFLLEKYTAKYFFKNIYGVIGISSDVINAVKKRIGIVNVKSFVLSNGIPLDENLDNNTPYVKDFDTINFLFVASVFQEWHGFERLIRSLTRYSGINPINIHVVGQLNIAQKKTISKFNNNYVEFIVHGKLNQEELKSLYKITNIACDSLAMYKLDMNESSTLKSKEYLINYIPFLYSAPDADFLNIKKYLYDCGNNNSDLDFDNIISWYVNIDFNKLKYEFDACQIEVLNWDVKIDKLTEWIES
jgi:glycosyltransferase involved in cell wall biosynthesis